MFWHFIKIHVRASIYKAYVLNIDHSQCEYLNNFKWLRQHYFNTPMRAIYTFNILLSETNW